MGLALLFCRLSDRSVSRFSHSVGFNLNFLSWIVYPGPMTCSARSKWTSAGTSPSASRSGEQIACGLNECSLQFAGGITRATLSAGLKYLTYNNLTRLLITRGSPGLCVQSRCAGGEGGTIESTKGQSTK